MDTSTPQGGVYLVTDHDLPRTARAFVPLTTADVTVADVAAEAPGFTLWYDEGPIAAPLARTSSTPVRTVARPLADAPGHFTLRVTPQESDTGVVLQTPSCLSPHSSQEKMGFQCFLEGRQRACSGSAFELGTRSANFSFGPQNLVPITSTVLPNTFAWDIAEGSEGLTRRRPAGPSSGPKFSEDSGFTDRLFQWLYHSWQGRMWQLWMMVVAVLGGVQYVVDDYSRRVQEGVIDSDIKILAESVSWQLVRWGVAAFIMMDVVLCARVSPNLQTFFCRFSTWVDLVSFCPLLLTLIPPIVQSHQQDWLEPVRMAPLLRTYRVMLLAEPKTMVYEAIRMIWCIMMLVMCCAGIISVLEPTLVPTFHDGIYFAIVTMTTVGYGDYSPEDWKGRMFICVFIFTAMITISFCINSLVTTITVNAPHQRSWVRTANEFVVVIQSGGSNSLALHAFLREFFHGNAGYTACDVLVLCDQPYESSVKQQITTSRSVGRVHFLTGSPLKTGCLQAVDLTHASAVFVLVPHHLPPELHPHADAEGLLITFSLSSYAPKVPIYTQCLLPYNKPVLRSAGATDVLCVEELRLQCLAASTFCKGLPALVLCLTTFSHGIDAAASTTPFPEGWLAEHLEGAKYGMFEVPVELSLADQTFEYICEKVYQEGVSQGSMCTLIGVRSQAAGAVLLNPLSPNGRTPQYKLDAADSLILLAASPKAAHSTLRAVQEMEENRYEHLNQYKVDQTTGSMLLGVIRGLEANEDEASPSKTSPPAGRPPVGPRAKAPGSLSRRGAAYGPGLPPGPADFQYEFDAHAYPKLAMLPPERLSFSLAPPSLPPPHGFEGLLVETLPADVKGHVVLIGPVSDHLSFLLPLRSHGLAEHRPVVFVVPAMPTMMQLQYLQLYADVYVLVRDMFQFAIQDLVATAHSVHVLKLPFQTSSHSPDIRMPHTEGTSVASDYGTLLLGLRLKALVPSLPSVMVLDYLSNSRFLMDARPLKEEPKPKQTRRTKCMDSLRRWVAMPTGSDHHPGACMGKVYCELMPDEILPILWFQRCVGYVLPLLLSAPTFVSPAGSWRSSNLYLSPIPESFYQSLAGQRRPSVGSSGAAPPDGLSQHYSPSPDYAPPTFGALFLYLLKEGHGVAIGLLRASESVNEEVNASAAPQSHRHSSFRSENGQLGGSFSRDSPTPPPARPEQQYHVYCCPLSTTVLHDNDRVYLLCRQEPVVDAMMPDGRQGA